MTPFEELTPQQRQIVRLASDGLTNREIGDRLFLSPRTVGSHLYRSYPKLGVADRHQLRDVIPRASTQTPRTTSPEARRLLNRGVGTAPGARGAWRGGQCPRSRAASHTTDELVAVQAVRYQEYPVSFQIDRVVELLIGRLDRFLPGCPPGAGQGETPSSAIWPPSLAADFS